MLEGLPLWALVLSFVLAALAVWRAGFRLTRHVDAIAKKTGIGREVLGAVLLGAVTSLPELAVAVTATLSGAPMLSVNDVIGSAAFNLVILAVADMAYGKGALTSTPANPGVLLHGVLSIVAFALVLAAIAVGDVLLLGIGAWSWALAFFYGAAIWIIMKSNVSRSWSPVHRWGDGALADADSATDEASLGAMIRSTALAGAAILVAGFVLARAGDMLADRTGLGESFVGGVLIAASTSLPEVSTVLAAVRLRRYEMAIADVFGTNLFNVTIIVLVDALHTGGPVLGQAAAFSGFSALLAVLLTALYLTGLLERRDRTLLRMGYDSIAVLMCYAAGLVVLFLLR